MTNLPFNILSQGISKTIGRPEYGNQHQGVSPKGPMDRFSYDIGNALLFNSSGAPALEFILAPVLKFQVDCYVVVTGARYEQIVLKAAPDEQGERILDHATVFLVPQGSILEFRGKTSTGFRSYLCFSEATTVTGNPEGRTRPALAEIYRWVDAKGSVRVIEGPEHEYLDNSDLFFSAYWKITNDFSEMGFRLETPCEAPKANIQNMISEAVADGTVQLTPKGPIVLLRYRQTVGGYPRIYNVISADIDRLGQYVPNQVLKFKKTSLAEAREIAAEKQGIVTAI